MQVMHATGGGLCGQVFALASSNESGEKKSRIRRSKEERKTLVESFIKLYQKSNNGNFPSLRLTHKEVGGSFYTVREIVREVIQENRVLAPPKVSLEEHENENSRLLDQQPLASISIDPPSSSAHSVLDLHDGYQIMSEQTIASSASSTHDSSTLYLDDEKILERGTEVILNTKFQDVAQISRLEPTFFQDESMQVVSNGKPFLQTQSDEFASHNTPNGAIFLEENQDSDKQETSFNSNDKFGSQTREGLDIVDALNAGQNFEESEVARSQLHFDTVETFPLHPIGGVVQTIDEEHVKLPEEAERVENRAIRQEIIMLDSSTGPLNSDNDEPHSSIVKEFSGKVEDGKLMQKPQHKFHESAKSYVASDLSTHGVSDPEHKVNTSSSGINSSYNGINQLDNGNSYSLDRINLETWEESRSNKATHPQSENTFVALLKAFFTAFSKFWSE